MNAEVVQSIMISSPRQPTTLQEIQYNPPRLRTFNENNEEFCSKSNVEESLRYLDKELQMLGLQTLYNSHGSFDLIQLVNVAHRLLRKYQHSGRYKEELETRVHRCSADLEHSQVTQRRLRQSNKALQNSINKYEETERQFQLERSSLQTKLKLQQDEVRKLNLLLQSTDNQHRHESKKREKELNSLKERTQQLLVDKSKSGASIEISRCLSRQDGRRRQWRSEASNSRNEEDLYQVVMSNFEKRCAALQSENSSLRDLLSDVLQELEELSSLGHPFLHKSVKKAWHERATPYKHCQMPVDMIYKRLSESIRQACSHLRANLSSASAAEPDLNSTFIVDAKDGNATCECCVFLLVERYGDVLTVFSPSGEHGIGVVS
ncbi:afadin- and alpha-actinin-binding protein B-like [Watersipora subatra]|uniref:afadin- and alpha-actinin-binding protein B-like n=1 Tax=Watersipora subatra TaxID=2589382 RepID=UPI00355BA216